MKGHAVVIGMIFLLTALTGAEEIPGVFRHPLGPATEKTFNDVCSGLAKYPFVRGNFEQEKYMKKLDRSLKSSGNYIIAADLGMVWDTVIPFKSTMVLGRDFIIQSRPGGQKTVLNAGGNETFLRMADVISAVFSGNSHGLKENFEIYFSGNAASWELGLIPLDKMINVFAQKLNMKGGAVINFIEITEQSGDSIKYIMSNHSFPAGLSDSEKALFVLP